MGNRVDAALESGAELREMEAYLSGKAQFFRGLPASPDSPVTHDIEEKARQYRSRAARIGSLYPSNFSRTTVRGITRDATYLLGLGRKMWNLFLLRHGEYDPVSEGKPMTGKGRDQIRSAASYVNQVLDGSDACLVSSPSDRTFESSCILAQEMGIERERIYPSTMLIYKIYKEYFGPEGVSTFIDVMRRRSDNLVLTTHSPVLGTFPAHFLSDRFGTTSEDMERIGYDHATGKLHIGFGQGIHIDMKTGDFTLFPHSQRAEEGVSS